MLAPVFNLNFGYLSIANRSIIALLNNKNEDYFDPMDHQIAGKSVKMLQLLWLFFWVFVVLAEIGVFSAVTKPIFNPIHRAVHYMCKSLKSGKKRSIPLRRLVKNA